MYYQKPSGQTLSLSHSLEKTDPTSVTPPPPHRRPPSTLQASVRMAEHVWRSRPYLYEAHTADLLSTHHVVLKSRYLKTI